jgi:hypothetical protein
MSRVLCHLCTPRYHEAKPVELHHTPFPERLKRELEMEVRAAAWGALGRRMHDKERCLSRVVC